MAGIRRILHASDFSRASRAAFDQAVKLARANRAELTVVHVFSTPLMYAPDGYALPRAYEEMVGWIRQQAQRQLDRLLARARAAGVRARGLLLEGIPHDRVVRAARSRRADLLVIGTHGRTGLARLVLGSVASRIIAAAPCPVLTVRGK